MSYFGHVVNHIDKGREGLNEGLPMGFNRLVEYLPNIQKKTFYLIGAGTKVGKTTFTDDCFLFNPFEYIMAHPEAEIDMDVDYFSFEVDKYSKIARGITRKLFKDYGLYVDTNYILSKGKNRISEEIYQKVIECREYFDKIEDIVTFQDRPERPDFIYNYLLKKVNGYGKSYWSERIFKDELGREFPRKTFDRFVPFNDKKYHIVIIDHISLIPTAAGQTTKQAMDELSHYLVELRNNYSIIPIVIQQLAFSSEEQIGNFGTKQSKAPTLSSFSDSKYLSRDSNVVLALHNPSEDKVHTYNGYNIDILGKNYRDLTILANRDGDSDISVGLLYHAKPGMFTELPHYTDQENLNKVYNQLKILNGTT